MNIKSLYILQLLVISSGYSFKDYRSGFGMNIFCLLPGTEHFVRMLLSIHLIIILSW